MPGQIDPSRVADLIDRLRAQHDELKSWRKVARLYPPMCKPGTLNRIVKEQGRYLPDDRKILRALGLIEPKQRTEMEKRITKMARETRKAVLVVKHE